jgi:hypothetical protein
VRTLLIVLGIWLLINALFVVLLLPPRKSRPRPTGALAPVRIDQSGHPFEEPEPILLRHVIISIAIGTFFSLTPPFIEAIESVKRFFGKRRR